MKTIKNKLSLENYNTEPVDDKEQNRYLKQIAYWVGYYIFEFNRLEELVLSLHEPDFTTALRVAKAINAKLGDEAARPSDSGTVRIRLPGGENQDLVGLVASLEQLDVATDRKARVILAERTGTVIIGENVRVSPVAIAHGNLSVEIKEKKDVSQPAPFAERGRTVVTKDSDVSVTEEQRHLLLVEPGASLGDLERMRRPSMTA